MARTARWFLVALAASSSSWVALTITAQERGGAAKPADAEYVLARECHINLIDKVTVATARTGVLADVGPMEGDQVDAHQVIARVRDDVARAQFLTAEKQSSNDIEIRYAKAAAKVDAQDYLIAENANRLLPNTFPPMEIERKRLAADKGALMIEQSMHQFAIEGLKKDEAKAILETHVIEAPFAGVVTKVYKKTGEGVTEAAPILDIVSTDRMRVEGYVPYRDVSRLGKGDLVKVRLDIRDQDLPEEKETFEGRITFIDVKVENQDGPIVRVHAEVFNRNSILREGLFANMAIYPGRKFQPQAGAAAPAAVKNTAAR